MTNFSNWCKPINVNAYIYFAVSLMLLYLNKYLCSGVGIFLYLNKLCVFTGMVQLRKTSRLCHGVRALFGGS